MARAKAPSPVNAVREAALEHLGEELERPPEPASEPAPRKPRPVEASVAALFPSGAVLLHELLGAAQRAWREAVDREVPSLERLASSGEVSRVDADAASGYLAVVTPDETWRAFVPREQLATIVALLVRRPLEEVARELGRGPGPIAARSTGH